MQEQVQHLPHSNYTKGVLTLPFFSLQIFIPMATTTDLDTELSAVNSILGAIGQSPITTLNFTNPEVSYIYNILTEVNKDVQNEGWHFNTEEHKEVVLSSDGELVIPSTALRYDLHDGGVDRTYDVVKRKSGSNYVLYDKVNHSSTFSAGTYYLDLVTLYTFDDLPNVFQRYITYRAASRAATQLVSNPQLVQLLQQQEAMARAACVEYECQQGDHSYFNRPHETVYRSYQPYTVLQR